MKPQLHALQNFDDKRQEQLIEKGDALVQCHISNVKNLYKLTQAVKEKMAIFMEMEALKAAEASKVQMEVQAKENHALKLQFQTQDQCHVELEKCQKELKLPKSESYQLWEKLQL